MKAFLLAGGYGTRLRPLTDNTPKCLVDIGGKPLLEHWLTSLSDAGVNEFLINTHYLNEQVEAFVAGSAWRDCVTLAYEPVLLGTLGSIKHNSDYLQGQDFIVAHADNYTDLVFTDFFKTHQQRPAQCDATMLLFYTRTPQSCGIVSTDEQGILTHYIEKPDSNEYGCLANAAVFLFSHRSLDELLDLPEDATDLCRDYVPHLTGKMHTHLHTGIMQDIGTIEALEQVRVLVNAK